MSEPLWTLDAFVEAAAGSLKGDAGAAITGISIDSRTLQPGDAFVAIKGDRLDGHDYVAAALEAGASVALVAEERLADLRKTVGMLLSPTRWRPCGRSVLRHGIGHPPAWLR